LGREGGVAGVKGGGVKESVVWTDSRSPDLVLFLAQGGWLSYRLSYIDR